MGPEIRRRAALVAGALVLVVQALLAGKFAATLWRLWRSVASLFGGFTTLSQRISQLKPAPFKTPWSWCYLAIFLLATIAVISALVVAGIREARTSSAPE